MKIFRSHFWFAVLSVGCLLPLRAASDNSSSISSEYLGAIRNADVQKLRELLDQGSSPNARDAAGNTPLMHAAAYASAACVRLLLDRGADVNATNAAGATALMRAAFDYDKVKLLVERGADVNARSGMGNSALLLAARPANSHRTVEFLLSRGADAKTTNLFGATTLMAAAAAGNEKSVKLLIKHGADVNAHAAPNDGGFLFAGGRSALMWAAFRGDVGIVKLLIDAGADVNGIGGLGTPLAQAAWADRTAAAKVLIERGARVNQTGPMDGYAPLHWATSTEDKDTALVKLLLEHQADPNLGGGENVDAFAGTRQTPVMMAQRRGRTDILAMLANAGASNAVSEKASVDAPPVRTLPKHFDVATMRSVVSQAVVPLQETSIKSKQYFVSHSSRQDCISCHQQLLPMAAIGLARKQRVPVDQEAEQQLVKMVIKGEFNGEIKRNEVDWQALFHPDAVFTKGYEVLAVASQDLPADESIDSWVHHLSAIQGKDGQWYNNLPRPPIQTGDIGATALAVHALQRYPLPGRKAQFANQVDRARQWLWKAKPQNTEGRIYQLLGLAWAGEPARKLQPLAKALVAEQRANGGWSQLPGLQSDAYATGQALYALRVAAGMKMSQPAVERGARYLAATQLEDGTWHVRRRAFPFQPTMNSGFPHGRDSWISAAGTSWAVMALSVPEESDAVALRE